VRFTPYWSLTSGEGCVGPAPGGWTAVTAFGHEHISVGIRFAWSRVRARDRRCVD
jgi:hypothetical protein